MTVIEFAGLYILVLGLGMAAGLLLARVISYRRRSSIKRLVQRHFGTNRLEGLVITGRKFHARIRADLQRAIDQFFASGTMVNLTCGVRQEHPFFCIGFSELLTDQTSMPPVAMEYEDVDIGEDRPVRCATKGLWLLTNQGKRYAVLMSPMQMPGDAPLLNLQVASENGDSQFAEQFFAAMGEAVKKAASYRGKVLSLDAGSMYSGQITGLTVHKLRSAFREDVILPPKTLVLLDRNVIHFVRHRPSLSKVGQAAKKGLLFYGPPGNGKTYTIHYLTGALEGHTTLLITGEQMALLGEYMTLARLLQPSVVVIEDVDLIARERTEIGPCQESLLNKLLNEMDGLKEEAEILFILTTNRPAELETALASRPGRIDQAIEFPCPDEECRERLAFLYSRGITLSDDVLASVVSKTQGTSAAFIKELMRRSLLHHMDRADESLIELQDVDSALEELLVSGGSLNLALLGAQADGKSTQCHAGQGSGFRDI